MSIYDFIQELQDMTHDPIQVTMEKGTKKMLLERLDRICGPGYEEPARTNTGTPRPLGWSLPTTAERDYWIQRAQETVEASRGQYGALLPGKG